MNMNFKILLIGIVTSFMLTTGIFVTSDLIKAEGPAEFNFIPRIIVYQGNVFINGKKINEYETDISGNIALILRSGDIELTANVGEFAPGRYHIQLGPRLNRGTVFEVWLEDQVKADESLTYDSDSDGKWNLSVIQDLHFSDMPVATPTPTPIPPTPTPTPVVVQPSFISGEIVSGSSGEYAGAGLKLYAVINDYTSETVEIEEGIYKIVIDPKFDYYVGEEIVFILEGIKSLSTHKFVAGEFNKEVNLIFPSIPATPVPPTPTSIPPTPKPSVPEPTRTPVPAVVEKIIVEVTSTPTPTPLAAVEPKEENISDSTKDDTQSMAIKEEENGGGACGANIDPNAPVSSGHIAMLLTPLLFIGFRKISGRNH
jgi:hypothetical protein